jgi:processive 1,2-diacylglycerol beta-glucosyltransferase
MSLSRQEKCDVLILSANLGTGHYQVSGAIKSSLEKECPDLNVFIYDFFDHVEPLLKHLIRFSYEQSIKHFSHGYKWFYEATRNLTPDSRLHQTIHAVGRQKLMETLERLSPKVIVCTFPNPAGVVSAIKTRTNINIPLISVITDVAVHSQWVHPNVDAYLVATDIVSEGLRKMNVPSEIIYVTGIPLRDGFERQTSSDKSWQKYNLNPDLLTLMVMGGGGGLLSGVETIYAKLSALSLPIQIIAVAGTNNTMYNTLERLSSISRIPIRVLGYVENIAELMEISDILLTKAGGVTIFEALSKNLPMIIYNPLPGHESGNVRFLLSHNSALLANSEDSAVEHIRKVINNPLILSDMKKSIQMISKPNASKDAAVIILKHLDSNRNLNVVFPKSKYKIPALKSKRSIKLKLV